MENRKDWLDLGFTAVAKVIESHYVDYVVYEIEDENPIGWHRVESFVSPDPVYSLDEAEIYLHGSVKWDGCSHWYFDHQNSVMLHGCSRQDLTNLGEVMARCWDWTAELCDSWDEI